MGPAASEKNNHKLAANKVSPNEQGQCVTEWDGPGLVRVGQTRQVQAGMG